MAKESGIGMTVTVDNSAGAAKDISNDVLSLSFGTPQGLLDVTGVDKSAFERIIGLADGNVQITHAFNDAADMSHVVLHATRSGSRTVAIAISGQTLTMECTIANAGYARGTDGSFIGTVDLQLNNGTAPAWT